MVKTPKIVIALMLAASLAACAGRQAMPVTPVQAYDNNISCEATQAEVNNNINKIAALDAEMGKRRSSNILIGAVGLFLFWPALFFLDVGSAPETEKSALEQRNAHLQTTMISSCGRGPAPQMPVPVGTPAFTTTSR